MIQHILVATDFSENARNALRYGLHFAHDLKTRLTLVNVTEPEAFLAQTPGDLMDQIWKEVEADVMQQMNDELEKLYKENPVLKEVKVKKEMRAGLVVDEILLAADDLKADWIIVGNHGYTGVKDLFFGNHTAALITRSHKPVLAVPRDYRYHGIKKIAYAVDFSSMADEELQTLIDLKNQVHGILEIVHVDVEEGKASAEEVKNFTEMVKRLFGQDHVKYEFLDDDDTLAALIIYMESSGADILALKHHHRNFFAKWVGRSISKDLLRVAVIPILVFED